MSSCGLSSGESGAEIFARLKRDLIPTLVSQLVYWPVCDFVTFKFTPVSLQVSFYMIFFIWKKEFNVILQLDVSLFPNLLILSSAASSQ